MFEMYYFCAAKYELKIIVCDLLFLFFGGLNHSLALCEENKRNYK